MEVVVQRGRYYFYCEATGPELKPATRTRTSVAIFCLLLPLSAWWFVFEIEGVAALALGGDLRMRWK